MTRYHYLKADVQHGPFTLDELKTQITRETLVWCEGMPNWVAAKEVPEIAAVLPPPPPESNPEKPGPVKQKKKYLNLVLPGLIVLGLIFTFFYLRPKQQIQETPAPEITFDTTRTSDLKKAYDEEAEQIEAEKAAKKMEEMAENIESFGKDWESLIKANFIKGERRGLGGIKGVVIEVSNNSALVLDEVYVDVYYIQSNGERFKTEQLVLKNFDPGEKKEKAAPDSERGRSIKLKVVGVKSKDTGLLTNKR